MKTIYPILFLLILAGYGCSKKETQPYNPQVSSVNGVGKIIPEAEIRNLAMESSGIIQTISLQENDPAKTGDVILCLDNQTENNDIAIAIAQVRTQKSTIEAQRARLGEEKAKTANLTTEYERVIRLYQVGAETGQTKDNLATDLQVQEKSLARTTEDLKREISKLEEIQSELILKQTILEKRYLRAPTDGILLDLTVKQGEYVKQGDAIGQFLPVGPKVVICEVDELFADQIQEGQKAYILSTGGRDTLDTGTVFFISRFLKKKSLFYEKAGETEDRRVLEVKIRPDKPTRLLLNAKIECAIQVEKSDSIKH